MEIREEDKMHLLGIADSIREIQAYIGQGDWKDYSQDTNVQQAISSHLQQIGSAAAILSDEFKDQFRDVDWDVLKGFQYANFDQELELDNQPQWHIIKEDLPVFLEQIEDLVTEVQREETMEDDLTLTGNAEDKYQLDPDSPEYQNRRSGDLMGEDLEDLVLTDEIREVPLGDIEREDDSFIDKRYEDVDLMKNSSLDDDLEDSKK
jgi:uncharacterized protein with HEPN domain